MKKQFLLLVSICSFFSLLACNTPTEKITEKNTTITEKQIEKEGLKKAYFASGCFWCVEAVFESVKGVKEAVSGYAGGDKSNPTYREISSGQLKHAEAVEVIYDEKQVSFKTLVKVFFGSQDPTTPNQQGPDRGPQYRSIAFYTDHSEKQIIEDYIAKLTKEKAFNVPIVTEVVKFEKFWVAEEYHQDYERLNPNVPYVRSVSVPRLIRFKEKFPELLKENY
ncbi:peptide-methionine (S)-S-oxide reductase MsrA [Vicingaceae bacterium]|nr:peptide-methionine (S)-S-oxide reductase MsrA [Vicingaceae bacterium]MDC1451742.1 peptide-methionine (S)-S-oxide reductase MsrA [Vicingaceae bacterium]